MFLCHDVAHRHRDVITGPRCRGVVVGVSLRDEGPKGERMSKVLGRERGKSLSTRL